MKHDLHQLLARCWSVVRHCGRRRQQADPSVGLALSLGVHQCARAIVARPAATSRHAPDDILLQNMATGHFRRTA